MQKFISAMLTMLLGLILTIVSVLAVSRTSIKSPGLLLSVADDLIGQPVSAIQAYGLSCSDMYDSDDSGNLRCDLEPTADIFSETSLVSSDGTILQIVYTMHSDTTQIGHLIWLWGRPEVVHRHRRSVFLFWRGRRIIAVAPSGASLFSISVPVQKVYFQCGNACLDWSKTSGL